MSRQKLRLLRVCRQLCPATAAVDLVIVFNCLLCAEPLLYDLLGDGNTKKKATLADLCSSSESPPHLEGASPNCGEASGLG